MKLIKDFKLNVEDFPAVLHARDRATLRWMLLDSSNKVTHSMREAFLDDKPHLAAGAVALMCRKPMYGPQHTLTRWVFTRYLSPEEQSACDLPYVSLARDCVCTLRSTLC